MLQYFWPAYQEKELPDVKPVKRAGKIRKLRKILKGAENEQLTPRHFFESKREQQNWLKRMEEIRQYEDIYANWEEYARILQYFNKADFKFIHQRLLSYV